MAPRQAGFAVTPYLIPDGLDDIVDLLVPELQERGVHRTEYTGTTLLSHLGLREPLTHRSAPDRRQAGLTRIGDGGSSRRTAEPGFVQDQMGACREKTCPCAPELALLVAASALCRDDRSLRCRPNQRGNRAESAPMMDQRSGLLADLARFDLTHDEEVVSDALHRGNTGGEPGRCAGQYRKAVALLQVGDPREAVDPAASELPCQSGIVHSQDVDGEPVCPLHGIRGRGSGPEAEGDEGGLEGLS